jgi:TonB family protein
MLLRTGIRSYVDRSVAVGPLEHSKSDMNCRLYLAVTILVVHVAALEATDRLFFRHGAAMQSTAVAPALDTRIIIQAAVRETVPIPEVHFHLIEADVTSVRMIRFDDADAGDISGVIGSRSSPQLARTQLADPELYARRGGITPGHAATALLAMEVLADGSVGYVALLRSSGNPAIDVAALEYARMLRWTPGTVDHQARSMRITLPVTLAYSG